MAESHLATKKSCNKLFEVSSLQMREDNIFQNQNLIEALQKLQLTPHFDAMDSRPIFQRIERLAQRQLPQTITAFNSRLLQYFIRDLRGATLALEGYKEKKQQSLIPLPPASLAAIASLVVRLKTVIEILDSAQFEELQTYGVTSLSTTKYDLHLQGLRKKIRSVFLALHLPNYTHSLSLPDGVDLIFRGERSWVKLGLRDLSVAEWIEKIQSSKRAYNRLRPVTQHVDSIYFFIEEPLTERDRRLLNFNNIQIIEMNPSDS